MNPFAPTFTPSPPITKIKGYREVPVVEDGIYKVIRSKFWYGDPSVILCDNKRIISLPPLIEISENDQKLMRIRESQVCSPPTLEETFELIFLHAKSDQPHSVDCAYTIWKGQYDKYVVKLLKESVYLTSLFARFLSKEQMSDFFVILSKKLQNHPDALIELLLEFSCHRTDIQPLPSLAKILSSLTQKKLTEEQVNSLYPQFTNFTEEQWKNYLSIKKKQHSYHDAEILKILFLNFEKSNFSSELLSQALFYCKRLPSDLLRFLFNRSVDIEKLTQKTDLHNKIAVEIYYNAAQNSKRSTKYFLKKALYYRLESKENTDLDRQLLEQSLRKRDAETLTLASQLIDQLKDSPEISSFIPALIKAFFTIKISDKEESSFITNLLVGLHTKKPAQVLNTLEMILPFKTSSVLTYELLNIYLSQKKQNKKGEKQILFPSISKLVESKELANKIKALSLLKKKSFFFEPRSQQVFKKKCLEILFTDIFALSKQLSINEGRQVILYLRGSFQSWKFLPNAFAFTKKIIHEGKLNKAYLTFSFLLNEFTFPPDREELLETHGKLLHYFGELLLSKPKDQERLHQLITPCFKKSSKRLQTSFLLTMIDKISYDEELKQSAHIQLINKLMKLKTKATFTLYEQFQEFTKKYLQEFPELIDTCSKSLTTLIKSNDNFPLLASYLSDFTYQINAVDEEKFDEQKRISGQLLELLRIRLLNANAAVEKELEADLSKLAIFHFAKKIEIFDGYDTFFISTEEQNNYAKELFEILFQSSSKFLRIRAIDIAVTQSFFNLEDDYEGSKELFDLAKKSALNNLNYSALNGYYLLTTILSTRLSSLANQNKEALKLRRIFCTDFSISHIGKILELPENSLVLWTKNFTAIIELYIKMIDADFFEDAYQQFLDYCFVLVDTILTRIDYLDEKRLKNYLNFSLDIPVYKAKNNDKLKKLFNKKFRNFNKKLLLGITTKALTPSTNLIQAVSYIYRYVNDVCDSSETELKKNLLYSIIKALQ